MIISYTESCEITVKEIASFYRLAYVDTTSQIFFNVAEEYDFDDNLIRAISYTNDGKVDTVTFYDNNKVTNLVLAREDEWIVIDGTKNYTRKKLKEVYRSLNNCLVNQSSFKASNFIRVNDLPELKELILPKSTYDQGSSAFQVVEEEAYFPGGLATLGKFLGLYLQYPESARLNNISGVVKVKFTINDDGSTSDFKIVQGLGYGCDEEAIRVLKKLPDWVPGYQRGVAVKSARVLPITFN